MVEDRPVVDRLLEIWPELVKIFEYWLRLPKSKQPKSKSFEAVKDAIDDVLYPAKLSFVSHFAGLIQPFLTCYQSDKPMIPFLHDDIFNLVFSLLQIVVKPDKLQECETMSDLKKIDLGKKGKLVKSM